jgi:aspartate racemase
MAQDQKIIGIIGGTSWESTVVYYQHINQYVREKLGGLNSAEMLLRSVNYAPIVQMERQGQWSEVGKKLALTAKLLQEGGAAFVLLCCNTLHKVTHDIERAIDIPFLHIADAAGSLLVKNHVTKVGLLGTQFTMEDGFYELRLQEKFGLHVIIPDLPERCQLDDIIYKELCLGKVLPASKMKILHIIESLRNKGAEAILLGCTELGMIVNSEEATVPLYDTTLLHAHEAARLSLL